MNKMAVQSARWMLLLSLAGAAVAPAAVITFKFTGTFNSSGLLFNAGDTFSGFYTFESTTPTLPVPDPSVDIQAQAVLAWQVDVVSSVVPDFSVTGTIGDILIGNDNTIGDRYLATLFFADPLPLGLTLNFFQMDLIDQLAGGADMVSSLLLDELPDLSLALTAGGRFFILSPPSGCSQCFLHFDSLVIAGLPPAETCGPGDTADGTVSVPVSAQFFPATDDFTMTGTGCAEQGVDLVFCFTPTSICTVQMTCDDLSANPVSVNLVTGACDTAPASCLGSQTGTGSATLTRPLTGGQPYCLVCEATTPSAALNLDIQPVSGDCGALPVSLRNFSVGEK